MNPDDLTVHRRVSVIHGATPDQVGDIDGRLCGDLFFHSYDFGGVVRDQLVRSAVLMLYTMLGFLGVVLSAVALLTARRLRQWDRPILLAGAGSAPARDAY